MHNKIIGNGLQFINHIFLSFDKVVISMFIIIVQVISIQLSKTAMKSRKDDDPDDGFSSNEQQRQDILNPISKEQEPEERVPTNNIVNQLHPSQQIKNKAYSLQPDISTGWKPKIALPKPIPLIFPDQYLIQTLKIYSQKKSPDVHLCYLGPHFNNTYSAWKVLGVQFPYQYMGKQNIICSNRQFNGSNPSKRQNILQFESMFESGNLDAVFQVEDYEYDCFMRVDANTQGHLQWYYFKVMNLNPGVQYRINICNFQKGKTLYLRGMKPYVFSYRSLQVDDKGWQQAGTGITYTKKQAKIHSKLQMQAEEKYYKLSFTISTPYKHDSLEIAYCPPYTYTRLVQFLEKIISKSNDRDILTTNNMLVSLGGLKIPLITITNGATQQEKYFTADKAFTNKKLVFVTGRIHPGESNGSFMMQGLITWLCGYSPQSEEMRSKFVFKIIPMVNPDGVVIGNYRTGLSGRDFNREFINPDASLFVQIYEVKALLQRCKSIYQKDFNFFIDFHGHTVKKNIFTYGPEFPLTNPKYYESRLFPKLLARRYNQFRYYSCVFKVAPGKQSTARAVLLRQIGINFAYTLQASNGSYYNQDNFQDVPFTIINWVQTGEQVCMALYDYWLLLKSVEQAKLIKKKQREIYTKSKEERVKKIQASFIKGHPITISSTRKKLKTQNFESQANSMGSKNMLSDLLNQISNEGTKEVLKRSDDELSEGKSDSENSKDDLQDGVIKDLLCPSPNKKKKYRFEIPLQKKGNYSKILKVVKRGSFLTQFQEIQDKRVAILQRPKKVNYIRKKMQSVSVTPSPTKEQPPQSSTAKIVNINFVLNPIPAYRPSMDKNGNNRLRTQSQESMYRPNTKNYQYSQSFRKTYLSLQRDMIRKDLHKKIQNNNYMQESRSYLKIEEIVGRRIFTETR